MITDKELKRLMDLAHAKLKTKFNPKDNMFMDRIKHKVLRFKKLNDVEEKRLKEIANA
jgi:hypothetical protein